MILENLPVAAVLVLIGYCVWMRRRSFRIPWERALTLSVILQGVGFALCAPIPGEHLGTAMFALTGVAHMDDYFGHLMLMSATAAMVYSVAMRLLPDDQIGGFMRWIELPCAVAAAIMLMCITNSRVLKRDDYPDFLAVPCHGWLKMYWVAYAVIMIYLLAWAVRLLRAMRGDQRRARWSTELLISSAGLGIAIMVVVAVRAVVPSMGIPGGAIWFIFCTAAALAVTSALLSWRARSCRYLARTILSRLEAPPSDESP